MTKTAEKPYPLIWDSTYLYSPHNGVPPKGVGGGWHSHNQLYCQVRDENEAKLYYCEQIRFIEPGLKPGTLQRKVLTILNKCLFV